MISDTISFLQRIQDAIENDTRVMTCGEAAYRLGCSSQRISTMISDGRLHKVSGNGVTGVRACEVYRFMK